MRTLMGVVALAVGVSAYAALPAAAEEKAKAGGELAARMQDLNLTNEQEAKIEDIRKEYKPKVKEAGKELDAVVKEEVEKVRGVLTQEQRTKLEATKEERQERRAEGLAERIAHLEALDLTSGEMAKIADIRKEFRPKVQEAGNKLRATVREEVEAIVAVIKS